ncbi:MAG: NTPase [Planctomycetota bacterium]
MPLNHLLTGRPGVGKTTAICRLAERLEGRRLAGFLTEEVRVGGRRRGFRIETFDGREGILADMDIESRWRVSKYGVDLEGFERLVCPMLESAAEEAEVVLIDEIGKMECFSDRFCAAVEALADAPVPLVATIAARGRGLIAAMKARDDVELHTLTTSNRHAFPQRLANALRPLLDADAL